MRSILVDVVNAGTTVTPAEARACVSAIQTQLDRDFAPEWRIHAELRFLSPRTKPRDGAWQLVLVPNRSVDCGYHELTRAGLPLGKVFFQEAAKCSSGWTSTASHELLELLVNPATTFGVVVEDRARGQRIYAYEVCDPCQDDRFTYKIAGVPMSDFVHRAWFEPWRNEGDGPFDHREMLTRPFEVPVGCYAEFLDVRRDKWLSNWGGKVTPRLNVYGVNDRGGSRLGLRNKRREAWSASGDAAARKTAKAKAKKSARG